MYLPPSSEVTGCSHPSPVRMLSWHDSWESFYDIIKSTEELWQESTEQMLQEDIQEIPMMGGGGWREVRPQRNSIRDSYHHSGDTQNLASEQAGLNVMRSYYYTKAIMKSCKPSALAVLGSLTAHSA